MPTPRTPALFVSHGSPMVAVEPDAYTHALGAFGARAPRPRAIVCVSAHWETDGPVRITASAKPETIHDFGGFPPALYELRYGAPGAPALAANVRALLADAGIDAVLDEARGLDHGAWVPLRYLYPAADVPTLQVSLPRRRTPESIFALGRALGSLRDDGVMLLGSGGVVHNLRLVNFRDKHAPVEPWARSFDDWFAASLQKKAERLKLLAHASTHPEGRRAIPTTEHYDPVFFTLGALHDDEATADVFTGFHHGTLSMRTFRSA